MGVDPWGQGIGPSKFGVEGTLISVSPPNVFECYFIYLFESGSKARKTHKTAGTHNKKQHRKIRQVCICAYNIVI